MTPLNGEGLNDWCALHGVPWRVEVAEEVTSTSDVLRQAAVNGPAGGRVLFAEHQTRGRGRRDNAWLASRGMDLTFSVALRPSAPVALWPRITTLAALAVCRTIEHELPLSPKVKWPNDIYLADRKVGGVLAETVADRDGMALILGIGLNVNTRDFPAELAAQATSLLREITAQVPMLDRQRLAEVLLLELHRQIGRVEEYFSEAVAEVRERSCLLGRQIRAMADGQEIYGRVLDLDSEGHLILGLPDGTTRHLSSADGVRQVI
jgi:BirA family biotin operon repressor/biotin-[acetyl-CoA-carboxylase] ligase